MELAQAKIPYLPPDWTVARVTKYAAKLGLFILVPGLHQIACKRRILGGLLLALYFSAEITLTYYPTDHSDGYFSIYFMASGLAGDAQRFSWLLLAVDLRGFENRELKLNFFLVLTCVAGIYFVPNQRPRVLYIHFVQESYVCPVFCKNDIVAYEEYVPNRHKIQIGEDVIVGLGNEPRYVSKVLLDSPKETCAEDRRTPLKLPSFNFFCTEDMDRRLYDFVVLGGPEPELKIPDGRNVTFVGDIWVHGFKLRKIGNPQDFFIISEGFTELVGVSLLTVYKWTGFNLFEAAKKYFGRSK